MIDLIFYFLCPFIVCAGLVYSLEMRRFKGNHKEELKAIKDNKKANARKQNNIRNSKRGRK